MNKEMKLSMRKYKWYSRIWDTFLYWFIGRIHPRKVLSALNGGHKDIRDYYGAVLSDDVEPARETIKEFQNYVECKSGDYVEIIVFK